MRCIKKGKDESQPGKPEWLANPCPPALQSRSFLFGVKSCERFASWRKCSFREEAQAYLRRNNYKDLFHFIISYSSIRARYFFFLLI